LLIQQIQDRSYSYVQIGSFAFIHISPANLEGMVPWWTPAQTVCDLTFITLDWVPVLILLAVFMPMLAW